MTFSDGSTSLGTASLLSISGAQLITNGGFETGNFSGWTPLVDFDAFVEPYPHSGTYAALLGTVGSLGYLSQTIATTPGAQYTLSWWLKSDGQTPNEFQASWDGNVVFDQVNIPAQAYQNYSFTVTATTTSTTLQFGFRDDPWYLYLDDVSATQIYSVATFTTSSLTVGTHAITAGYSGDTNFATSSGSVLQTVNKASASTTVTSSVNPLVFGQNVTFTATVSAVNPGAGTPTGTVTFLDGATSIGIGLLNTLNPDVAILRSGVRD